MRSVCVPVREFVCLHAITDIDWSDVEEVCAEEEENIDSKWYKQLCSKYLFSSEL